MEDICIMNVNLDQFFDAQKATFMIFGKVYEVDDDYKKVLGMEAFGKTLDQQKDEVKDSLREFLIYALVDGEKAAGEILSHKISFSMYNTIINGITAAMTGRTIEEVESAKKEALENGRFPKGKGKRV